MVNIVIVADIVGVDKLYAVLGIVVLVKYRLKKVEILGRRCIFQALRDWDVSPTRIYSTGPLRLLQTLDVVLC